MKVRRTIPPAAAPLYLSDLGHGLLGMLLKDKSIRRFEEEMKAYFGVKYVFPVSSGKAALALILQGLKSLSSRREVIIPAYTCFSVPAAVRKAGLEISLCDMDPETFDFNSELLEKAITEETLCVVPSHLFGLPAAMDKINDLARRKGAYVVEDAAQAMGGTYHGQKLGTLGDVGFFSLGRGKNITCGSGGVIVTNSKPIADAISGCNAVLRRPGIFETWKEFIEVVLMALFIHPRLYWFPAGLPFLKLGQTVYNEDFPIRKLSGMKAGLLRCWKRRLETSNQKRAAAGADLLARLSRFKIQEEEAFYLRLPVLVDCRRVQDYLYSLSQERGLGVSLMYPTPIHEIREMRGVFQHSVFPGATEISERLLTLPTHSFISERDREAIGALFEEAVLTEMQDASTDGRRAAVSC